MSRSEQHEVAVVGAGIIGLSVALRARLAGLSVVVIDRGTPGGGTSRSAAGMLAPVSEADPAEPDLLELLIESSEAWPAFAAQLTELGGGDPMLRQSGTLLVSRDRDAAEEITRAVAIRERLGLQAQRLTPSAARALEPALAPTIRASASLPGDHSVDPRAAIAALVAACDATGVAFERSEVDARALGHEHVVIATGVWSGSPVRPIKGQALLLRDAAGPGLLERIVRFDGGYIVPRGDGGYYLGATVEERGFDTTPTALAHYELLRDCAEVLPGVLELEIEEIVCALRPGTPDNAPLIGRDPDNTRLVWATGHYRHGIVLAPVTAELVAGELVGEPRAHAFGPGRFGRVTA